MNEMIELGLRMEAGLPVVSSRNVAQVFEKRHADVLRDIDETMRRLTNANLRWFISTDYLDEKGEQRRAFDLTRDGFTLLVMGWNGERAMAFKVAYIEAFNLMEQALRDGSPVSTTQLLQTVREIVGPLAVRFDSQDLAIGRMEKRVDTIAEDVGSIKLRLFNSRRRISEATKRDHVEANKSLGGRCQCCGEREVICDGTKSPFAEHDHFYQASYPDADHTWLICKKCHNDLTNGRMPRDKAEAHFRAYQDKRRRLPGRAPTLF